MLKKDFCCLKCAKCGKRVRWDDSFCSACGSKIELTEAATIVLPYLDKTIDTRELWQIPPKVKSDDVGQTAELKAKKDDLRACKKSNAGIETKPKAKANDLQDGEKSDVRIETTESKAESNVSSKASFEYIDLFDSNWRESWLKYYRVAPARSICLLTSVIAELLAFWPYFFAVLYVFHYETFCACLAISSAAVLLTHGVCVCVSYYSIFKLPKECDFAEVTKAVEKTQKRLNWGVGFISAFLLAFFICMFYNHIAEAPSNSEAPFVPVSFDD